MSLIGENIKWKSSLFCCPYLSKYQKHRQQCVSRESSWAQREFRSELCWHAELLWGYKWSDGSAWTYITCRRNQTERSWCSTYTPASDSCEWWNTRTMYNTTFPMLHHDSNKMLLFCNRVHIGRSRSSKVVDFGTNRKGVCDFLLATNKNFGPILHRFWDTTTQWLKIANFPYPTLI